MPVPSRVVGTSRDGTHISAVSHSAETCLGTLAPCHGIGEHCGRYARFIAHLLEAGISTLSLDLRGHGASDVRRGHVEAFSDYLDDLHSVLSHFAGVRRDEPGFLFGHSMGAVAVTNYLLRRVSSRPIQGLVLSSPGFTPAVVVPRIKRRLASWLLPLAPRLRFTTGIRPDQLMSERDAHRAFAADPFTYSKVSLRWYAQYQQATQACFDRAAELALPLYVFVGAGDTVVAPSGARRFVDVVASSDNTLRVWDGLLHEPPNEREGDHVGCAIVDWLLQRV